MVLDAGPGRNATSDGVHNFLSRDGVSPAGLRDAALAELAAYPTVRIREGRAVAAEGQRDDFTLTLADGSRERARRILLATGVQDVLPPIEGLAARWGRGVVHCPYCHGWERRGQPIAVLESGGWGVHLAVHLRRFTDDVILCVNGAAEPSTDQCALLADRGVAVRLDPIDRLEGEGTSLERIVFEDGTRLARRALSVHPPTRQRSDLPERLGCRILNDGAVEVNDVGQTRVPGVFAVGDMARRPSMPLSGSQVVIAAADGVVAAVIIDQELLYSSIV